MLVEELDGQEESMSSKKLEEALKKVQAVDEDTQASIVGGARPVLGSAVKPVGPPASAKKPVTPACVATLGGVIGKIT